MLRRAVGVAGLGLGVGLALAVQRRRDAIEAVPPELRTVELWLPLGVDNRLVLGIARRMLREPTDPVPGVRMARQSIGSTSQTATEGADQPPVEVLVFEPDGRTRPSGAVVFLHGGGYIMGDPESSADTCSRLARDLDVLVVVPRYRLAPEHPFPAGLDDCWTALRWVHEQAETLGVDRARVAVVGESAGGGLAAALAQRAADADVPLALQVLVYPMLDDRTVLRADHEGRGRFNWTPRSNRYAWTCYLGGAPGATPPAYAVPARRTHVAGLAPAWVGVGDLDLFHVEDVEYAERLRAAGVPVELHVVPGMPHAADHRLEQTVPAMREFRARWAAALDRAVGAGALAGSGLPGG
jgi:acetyl esterase/lipase